MPLAKMKIRPGVTVELTPTLNEGGYSASQLIRFFSGQLQKLGGWTIIAGATMAGVCRMLFGWSDLTGLRHLAAGTDERLYVLTNGTLSDITPITFTSNIAPAIAATIGSATVTITDVLYAPNVGDWIYLPVPVGIAGAVQVPTGYYQVVTVGVNTFTITVPTVSLATASPGVVPTYTTVLSSPTVTVVLPLHGLGVGAAFNAPLTTTVGGLTITGPYSVATVIDVNSFTITAGGLATSSTTAGVNGGNMRVDYLLPGGSSSTMLESGFGASDFGGGDWGGPNSDGWAPVVVRTWSLDHFGQDLIASPDLGAIYYWSPSGSAPAVLLSGSSPIINRVVFAMPQIQIVIAAGSSLGSVYNPTLVRWCDSGDFTDWTATSTNLAGSFQLPTGSYVTAGLATGLGALIWTDTDVWTMTYQGLPYVFGFNQIGTNCGAISKHAPAVIGQRVIWPSQHGFFTYSGGTVQPMACPVWDYFFNNIDVFQSEQTISALNTLFNEVAWYFRTEVPDTRYVKWNYLEDLWDCGILDRTAWADHSHTAVPVGADSLGNLYTHETGQDADGSPLLASARTGYMDLQDGNDIAYVNAIIPDFLQSAGSTVQVTVYATDNPGDTPRAYGPYAVTPTTRRFNVSLRGRQVAFEFSSGDLGSSWRTGATRVATKQAGQRP